MKLSGSMIQRMSGIVVASQVTGYIGTDATGLGIAGKNSKSQESIVGMVSETETKIPPGDSRVVAQSIVLQTNLASKPLGATSIVLSSNRATSKDQFVDPQTAHTSEPNSDVNQTGSWDQAEEELFTERGIIVIQRVSDKLTGLDFVGADGTSAIIPLDVHEQIDRLIKQATSNENLCTSFFGWCPFW